MAFDMNAMYNDALITLGLLFYVPASALRPISLSVCQQAGNYYLWCTYLLI
jgi:hypothetical protein